jgi:adenosylcobinamide-phosphate synthase
MTDPFAIVAAYALDVAFGEPPNAFHPVAWIGRIIAPSRDWALRAGRLGQTLRGAVVALAIPMGSAALAYGAVRCVEPSRIATVVATTLLLKSTFAVRALRDAAFVVRDALEKGDLDTARRGLRALCSRDAGGLDAEALVAATVESVAENTSDSIVAPLLFFTCFGLPGAVFYRAVNTLDAMIGYHGRLEHAGKAAARLDDFLNLVPARLTALLLLLAGGLLGAEVRRGVIVLRRDGARTESPNAGRPMAAIAGLLGVRLTKPGHYELGDPQHPLTPRQITAAWRVVSLASLGAVCIAAAVSGAVHG